MKEKSLSVKNILSEPDYKNGKAGRFIDDYELRGIGTRKEVNYG
jgi:hypothetical protein